MAYKKRLYRIRGGFSGATTGGFYRSPVVKRTGLKLGQLAKSAAMAAGAWAANRYGPKIKVNATRALDKFVGKILNGSSPVNNSPMIIPGVGVLPSRKSQYGKITSSGTGISKSSFSYTSGTPNTDYIQNGQKSIYRVMDSTTCFKITSVPPNNAAESFVFNNATFLSTAYTSTLYIGNSGTGVTDSGYLRQNNQLSNIYIHSHYATIRITSSCNLNFLLRIYDLSCKQTSTQANIISPRTGWQSGVDEAFGTNSSSSFLNEGIYPGHSKYFRDGWNVDKITDVTFAAGGSHQHTIERNLHSLVPHWLVTQSSTNQTIAGLTSAVLLVLTSTPVHDQTTESSVGIGTASADVVISHQVEYYAKLATNPVIFLTNSTDTVTTEELVTDSDFTETAVVS